MTCARSLLTTIIVAITLASLAGCDELMASMDSDAVVELATAACPEGVLAVGDSLPFTAKVVIRASSGGMSLPGDGQTRYRSVDHPDSFRWSVSYPPAATPTLRYESGATSEITPRGVLVASRPGVVYVSATSAGKTSARFEITVIPRVTRFAVTPRDTSVQVGDTVRLRADFVLEGARRPGHDFRWMIPEPGAHTRLIEQVERDPENRGPYEDLTFTAVAVRAGTLSFIPCAGGVHTAPVTIRIAGQPLAVNRDVPPRLRLAPAETTVYVGETLYARLRILNASLGNGPYAWRASAGDGFVATGSAENQHASPAFGFDQLVFDDHRYLTTGKFPVEITVTDSAGRSATLRTIYTAVRPEFTLMLMPDDSVGVIRLSSVRRDVGIAIITEQERRLDPVLIWTSPPSAHSPEIPALRFGRTVFDQRRNGHRLQRRDVNRDGVPDLVVYVDRQSLIENGDMRVGKTRLVMSGGITRSKRIVPGKPEPPWFSTPIHGVVEFTVVP